jgi:hypothetical protein
MTAGTGDGGSSPRVAVVMTPHWESASEEGWITRQVAGALATVADVHVVTPEGTSAGVSTDSVFTLHRLGTPIDPLSEISRDLLLEGMVGTASVGLASASGLVALSTRGLLAPWDGAAGVLAALSPEVVVIAGTDTLGARRAVDRYDPTAHVVLLALDGHRSHGAHRGDGGDGPGTSGDLVTRSRSVLVVTEDEGMGLPGDPAGTGVVVRRIGAPLSASPSARTEPNTWVGDTGYILVLTDVAEEADNEPAALARLLRLRFPDPPVGIVHSDAFCAWHRGRVTRGWAVERTSDLHRLMAWARVTVDLRPGRLFARRCVDSLLFGTPIVVPADSRGREHAERGRGGLWFSDPAELTWCVDALLDTRAHDAFALQGRAYAEEEYGSTDAFVDRVLAGCGLPAVDVRHVAG